jgi:hypothetical protein
MVPCSVGVSSTRQHHFFFKTNQHQPPATNQSAVFFSRNKLALVTKIGTNRQPPTSQRYFSLTTN